MEADPIFPRRSFSPEELRRVLLAAAPIPPNPISKPDHRSGKIRIISRKREIEERLSSIAALVALKIERKDNNLPPSRLAKRFHAIADAADHLLKLFTDCDKSEQVQRALLTAANEHAERIGGFKNRTPLNWPSSTGGFVDYDEDGQLQDNIEGVEQLRDWARRAEEAEIEPRYSDHITAALDGILRIWVEVLGREIKTAVDDDGLAYGQLVEFSLACLAAVGITEGRGKPLGEEAIRGRIRRRLDAYEADPEKI